MSPAILLITGLCVLCFTMQTFGNKMYSINYKGDPNAATPAFSLIYGLVVSMVTFAISGFSFHASPATWALGLLNGVALVLFNLSSIKASRSGPYAFQSVVMLFGHILLTLAFCAFFWQDHLGATKLVGIVVMLVSFVVMNMHGMDFSSRKKGYFFWVTVLFLSNGTYGIVMDAQQRVTGADEHTEMIIILFFTSAVISLFYLLAGQKKKSGEAFRKMGGKAAVFALCSSLAATGSINLLVYLLSYVPASILYTIVNGGILIFSILLSRVVLKEHIKRSTVVGIGIAVVSMLLLNL